MEAPTPRSTPGETPIEDVYARLASTFRFDGSVHLNRFVALLVTPPMTKLPEGAEHVDDLSLVEVVFPDGSTLRVRYDGTVERSSEGTACT